MNGYGASWCRQYLRVIDGKLVIVLPSGNRGTI